MLSGNGRQIKPTTTSTPSSSGRGRQAGVRPTARPARKREREFASSLPNDQRLSVASAQPPTDPPGATRSAERQRLPVGPTEMAPVANDAASSPVATQPVAQQPVPVEKKELCAEEGVRYGASINGPNSKMFF